MATPCEHRSVYECAHCGEMRCMSCDEPARSDVIKTAVKWCPKHEVDGKMGRLPPQLVRCVDVSFDAD